MKTNATIITLIALLTVSANSNAFERDSLVKGTEYSHGGFGGFTTKTTNLNGKTETMVGGKGAWLVNHNVYLGMAGYGTKNNVNNTEMDMGYGGVLAGYIFNPQKILHYNVELLVGAGGLGDSNHQNNNNCDDPNGDAFAVIEPGANVSFAVTKYSDVSLGVSYRYVQETNQVNLSDSDLSGWSVNTSIVFGKF
ncbi:MAG: hypothetical protein OEM38_05135 [Gammaproteobacteria bacterium]|nr:hypothetical protein [Gammaproteobacteria bacterium]